MNIFFSKKIYCRYTNYIIIYFKIEDSLIFIFWLNYTFGPRVLAYSRKWSCLFKIEQNGPSFIIFVAFFVLPPIFSSKNAQMANEGIRGIAKMENEIYMSLKHEFLMLKYNLMISNI